MRHTENAGWWVGVREAWHRSGLELVVILRNGLGVKDALVSVQEDGELKMEEIEEGDEIHSPTMYLSRDLAKSIVNALSEVGMRPDAEVRREAGLTGRLEATEGHLEDMRTLLFHKMKVREDG